MNWLSFAAGFAACFAMIALPVAWFAARARAHGERIVGAGFALRRGSAAMDEPRAPRQIVIDTIAEMRGTDRAARVLAAEADAVLTALADAGYAIVVRRRVESGDDGGWNDWPDAAARA